MDAAVLFDATPLGRDHAARGIGAADLPDRWEGLSSFESIIWTNAPVQGLGIDQARALLDWTRRGGNLVIVLPESGDPWGIGGQRTRTPLGEALPLGVQGYLVKPPNLAALSAKIEQALSDKA